MDDAYEPLVREVAAAWAHATADATRHDLFLLHPGLYWSVARLAARWEAEHEQGGK